MAKKAIIPLAICIFTLCLALVGCGGPSSEEIAAKNKEAFIGTWDLVEMTQKEKVTGADDLDTLKSLGLEVFVNFNDDNTMVLALFGKSMKGTWEAASTTEGTIEMEGQKVTMTIQDSRLKFEQEGASLIFEKGEAKEAPKESVDSKESKSSEGESTEGAEGEGAEGEGAQNAENTEATESVSAESSESASSSEASTSENASSSSSSAAA